jgi:hypothetical protein
MVRARHGPLGRLVEAHRPTGRSHRTGTGQHEPFTAFYSFGDSMLII